MLIVTRKKDQAIDLNGGEISIVVVEARNGRARLGIRAPKDITIHRREVQELIDRENAGEGAEPCTSEQYSETWPRSGMTRSGIAFRRCPSAPLTKGTGSGSWPTPLASEGAKQPRGGLQQTVRMFPTPVASDANTRGDDVSAWQPVAIEGRQNVPDTSMLQRQGIIGSEPHRILPSIPEGSDADCAGLSQRDTNESGWPHPSTSRGDWWAAEPDVGRVANGVASRVDRLKAIGNGQVPAVVVKAWETLSAEL